MPLSMCPDRKGAQGWRGLGNGGALGPGQRQQAADDAMQDMLRFFATGGEQGGAADLPPPPRFGRAWSSYGPRWGTIARRQVPCEVICAWL